MRGGKFLAILLCGALIGIGAAAPAWCLEISTDAQYEVVDSGGTLWSDQDSDAATSGAVASQVIYSDNLFTGPDGMFGMVGPSYIGMASAYADENANLAARATFLAYQGEQSLTFAAASYWAESFTATDPGDYFWDFTLPNGALYFEDWSAGGADLSASYLLEVVVNGNTVWTSSASLQGNASAFYYDTTGTALPGTWFGTAPPIPGDPNPTSATDNYFGINYDTYNGHLYLGNFGPGEVFSVEVTAQLDVSGQGQECGATAYFGDPGAPTPPAVPIPGAVWLLGSGMVGLAGLRRKLFK